MKRQVLAPGLLTQSLAIFDLPARATLHYAVAVEVWTDRGEDVFYLPGDPLCVYFRAPEDCYLLLYQMDTQGNVYLLFPAPYSRAFFARAGEVPCVNDFLYDCHLAVHGTVGVGYIGALASPLTFWVPRWLMPHPVYHTTRVVYGPAHYLAFALEPYFAIRELNERIVVGWGIGLRLGFGYCWFYVVRS